MDVRRCGVFFGCLTRYLSERSERVGYWVEHEKKKYISISKQCIILLYEHNWPWQGKSTLWINENKNKVNNSWKEFLKRANDKAQDEKCV